MVPLHMVILHCCVYRSTGEPKRPSEGYTIWRTRIIPFEEFPEDLKGDRLGGYPLKVRGIVKKRAGIKTEKITATRSKAVRETSLSAIMHTQLRTPHETPQIITALSYRGV